MEASKKQLAVARLLGRVGAIEYAPDYTAEQAMRSEWSEAIIAPPLSRAARADYDNISDDDGSNNDILTRLEAEWLSGFKQQREKDRMAAAREARMSERDRSRKNGMQIVYVVDPEGVSKPGRVLSEWTNKRISVLIDDEKFATTFTARAGDPHWWYELGKPYGGDTRRVSRGV